MVETDITKVMEKFGITGMVAAVLMIIFGVLVIVFPNLIAWIVGLYLIIVGAINLFAYFQSTQIQQQQSGPQPRGTGIPVQRKSR